MLNQIFVSSLKIIVPNLMMFNHSGAKLEPLNVNVFWYLCKFLKSEVITIMRKVCISLFLGIPYDGPSAAVWSLGCILYIITTGTMPFDDSNKIDQIKQMKKGVKFTKSKQKLSKLLENMITSMLNTDASKRLPFGQIEKADWCVADGTIDDEETNSVLDPCE